MADCWLEAKAKNSPFFYWNSTLGTCSLSNENTQVCTTPAGSKCFKNESIPEPDLGSLTVRVDKCQEVDFQSNQCNDCNLQLCYGKPQYCQGQIKVSVHLLGSLCHTCNHFFSTTYFVDSRKNWSHIREETFNQQINNMIKLVNLRTESIAAQRSLKSTEVMYIFYCLKHIFWDAGFQAQVFLKESGMNKHSSLSTLKSKKFFTI